MISNIVLFFDYLLLSSATDPRCIQPICEPSSTPILSKKKTGNSILQNSFFPSYLPLSGANPGQNSANCAKTSRNPSKSSDRNNGLFYLHLGRGNVSVPLLVGDTGSTGVPEVRFCYQSVILLYSGDCWFTMRSVQIRSNSRITIVIYPTEYNWYKSL